MKNALSIGAVVILVIIGIVFFSSKGNPQFGSVGGLQATVATSSFQAVTAATVQILFATSTSCSSRMISNQAGAIMLTFNDRLGQRPTAVRGLIQTASTTREYNSELYGCGAVYVYPYGTDTLTLVETL